MSKTKGIVILLGVIMVIISCKQKESVTVAAETYTPPAHTYSQHGSVREMNIWPEQIEFPEYEGKAEFVSYCGICHSLKYITAQPAFDRPKWTAEVHKMVVNYGAPVDSAVGEKIVSYIMEINGKK